MNASLRSRLLGAVIALALGTSATLAGATPPAGGETPATAAAQTTQLGSSNRVANASSRMAVVRGVALDQAHASAQAAATRSNGSRSHHVDPFTRPTHGDVDLGLPTHANLSNPKDYLVARPGYVGSFNSDRRQPNWIAYKVTPDSYGDQKKWLGRQDAWSTDPHLPSRIHQASLEDYVHSGYDRGHEKREGDAPLMHGNESNNKATYFLTNIVPQAANVNRGPWNHFENYYRDASMQQKKDVRIYIGNLFEGHTETIGANKIPVPTHLFKIAVISDHGTDVKDISAKNTRVLAVLMPNNNKEVQDGDNFAKYLVAPGEVIKRSGYDGILSRLPPQVRQVFMKSMPKVEAMSGAYKVDGEVITNPPPSWVRFAKPATFEHDANGRPTLKFESVPDEHIRDTMKAANWRWDPEAKVWYSPDKAATPPAGVPVHKPN